MSFDLETEVPEILDRVLSLWVEERRAETPIDIGADNHVCCPQVAERLEKELAVRFPDSVVSARVEEGGRIVFSKNPI
jgi:hypothetical protein